VTGVSQKAFSSNLIGVLCFGLGGYILWLSASPAAAQCGSNPAPDSSCYSCHVQEDPIAENGVWHGTHANKDCGAKCHGGNCSSMNKDLAHMGMVVNPLSDVYTNCHSCHPDDYLAKAEIFAADLNIAPESIPTPTLVPSGKVSADPLEILPSPVNSNALPLAFIFAGSAFTILLVLGIAVLAGYLRK
jgi:hypothetical protein